MGLVKVTEMLCKQLQRGSIPRGSTLGTHSQGMGWVLKGSM